MDFDLNNIMVNYTTEGSEPKQGPVTVGWLLTDNKAGVLYDPPKRLASGAENRNHAKSASRCPAVINMEARYFVINCPFDINIGFGRDKAGKPILINRAGTKSPIRSNKLGQVMHMTAESEWRFPDRPTIQMKLPYLFIADEPVYMTQLSCFAHYRKNQLPGTIFGGRFPINVWPRPLMWAFEWHDPTQDIVLKRGEPLFYCQFESTDPTRPIQMVEAEMNKALEGYLEQISGAVNYVNQTFGLFKAAERIRPEKLVTKKGE